MRAIDGFVRGSVLAVSCHLAVGCAPVSLPPTDEVLAGLSDIILDPEESCFDLQASFDLLHLELAASPDEIGIPYEDWFVPLSAGEELHAWYLPAVQERGTIIVSMGASGSMACYLYIAQLLNANGFSVAMYEYQGFGLSTGEASLATLANDLNTVLDHMRSETGKQSFTLYGISLGTVPSVAVAVARPKLVNGVILDSPLALATEIRRFGAFLGQAAEEIVLALVPALRTDTLIVDVEQPLLIFTHDQDPLTPTSTAQRLYDAASGSKQIVHFPHLSHARGQFFSTREYTAALEAFLAQVWDPPSID